MASKLTMPLAMLAGTESRSSLAYSFSNSSLTTDVTGSSEMECRSASTSDERCEEKVVEEVGDLLLLLRRRRRFGFVGGLGGG